MGVVMLTDPRRDPAPEPAGRPPEAAELPALRAALDRQTGNRPRIEPMALRIEEVAASLGLSRRAVERERAAGRFPKHDAIVGCMWVDKAG